MSYLSGNNKPVVAGSNQRVAAANNKAAAVAVEMGAVAGLDTSIPMRIRMTTIITIVLMKREIPAGAIIPNRRFFPKRP
jgi:hypothetical protein